MPNNHYGSYNMTEEAARMEAKSWVENGGQVREDRPHQGNNSSHLHLYPYGKKSEDFVVNYEKGTGY